MDTGDTRSIEVLEAISDHNTYEILKRVSMKRDGYTIVQLSKVLKLTKNNYTLELKN